MAQIDPLQHLPIVHDAFNYGCELINLSDFVVSEHD